MNWSRSETTLFRPALAVALVASLAAPVMAAKTEVFERSGSTLRVGKHSGVVVTPDGRLAAGPEVQELGRPATARIWDLAVSEGLIYAGSGDAQGLLRVAMKGGDLEVVDGFDEDPEILAIERGTRGQLFVATGPSGSIYKLDPSRQRIEEVVAPEEEYVWDMQMLPNGTLAYATGSPARVYTIDGKGKGEPKLLWATNEKHVRKLALTPDGRLLAGTVGSGWVVEISDDGKGFVLLDSERPEVAALAVDSEGVIWAGFTGGTTATPSSRSTRNGDRTSGSQQSITVRPNNNGANGEDSDEDNGNGQQRPARRPTARAGGGDGGALVRLPPVGEPKTVWRDRSLVPFALVAHPQGGVLLGTGSPAQVWRFDAEGRLGMWTSYEDARAVSALALSSSGVAVATSNPSILFAYGPDQAENARWTSDVFDATTRTQFGRVHAVVSERHADAVDVFVRVGNTADPGPGWTAWTEVEGAAAPPHATGASVDLPRSRFAQLRVAFDSSARDATVSRVGISYRRANRGPEVKSVEVQPPGLALRAIPPSGVTSGDSPVVDVPDAFESVAKSTKSSKWRSKQAYEAGALTVRWEGSDPDGDQLLYDLHACQDDGEACTEWVELARDLERDFYSFDSRVLPDGVYLFRVTASDALGNVQRDTLTHSESSEQVLIDHTAPVIDDVSIEGVDGGTMVRVVARDPSGRLAGAEVSSAAGHWQSIPAVDGVEDGDEEVFEGTVDVDRDSPFVGVRVIDASGNVSVRRIKR